MSSGGGKVFILVQHLDAVDDSMIVELLSPHTAMTVTQAQDNQPVEPDHLYITPPGRHIAVQSGALRLVSAPAAGEIQMPFDFLLHSLAAEYGAQATAVVLSGAGTDGSLGIRFVHDGGGTVYVQEPSEAGYDGMPTSAIESGVAHHVMPVRGIAGALLSPAGGAQPDDDGGPAPHAQNLEPVGRILDLLRVATGKDFSLYRRGTLLRRLERRMGMVGLAGREKEIYLEALTGDPAELSRLAADLLINVTSFFRDPDVFEVLKTSIIPGLLALPARARSLRLWVAGCSTGEEAYSLAMVAQECISAAKLAVKLQMFASDIDEEAIAFARDGLYPKTIEADVGPERLKRFFIEEEDGYRVVSDLRSAVVFTVQNVLADPPFSHMDLISCRNLLIYLGPEAQTKVTTLCHFALNDNGVLLIGHTETLDDGDGRFEMLDKAARVFRRKGQRGHFGFLPGLPETRRGSAPDSQTEQQDRQAVLADLSRQAVIDAYAPASVLINKKYEVLFSLGPVHRYLHMAAGYPTQDLFTMMPRAVHAGLRSALHRALHAGIRTVATGFQHEESEAQSRYDVAVQPVKEDGKDLLLVSFIEGAETASAGAHPIPSPDNGRADALELELAATRTELQTAIRDLENAAAEQKTIHEEILSLNEEYQSTNEELLTSKEELQSINGKLAARNTQLQDALERQRATTNDLENVLSSTDVATLFLDADQNIRYFTPATRSIFHLLVGDIGRPLADLNSQALDSTLLSDAGTVLRTRTVKEREVRATGGTWYMRRVLPYRTQNGGIEGVVITFADITTQHHAAEALERAKRAAERANAAKSRFLAAASHDLRQPLQTLVLLQGLLEKSVHGERAQKLLRNFRDTIGAMSGMLNALLDINQIEAGTVTPRIVTCAIDSVLPRLQQEFSYGTAEKGLALRFVPSRLAVRTDPRLLEQMIRNLLANALKYTRQGKILLGCRRHGEWLTIEIWDSGVGIPAVELQAIFDEYHQVAGTVGSGDLGLGLGLSTVKRLAMLLGHKIHVRSTPGKGSVFSIQVPISRGEPLHDPEPDAMRIAPAPARSTGSILVVDDDPQVRALLEIALRDEHHLVHTADDAATAFELVSSGAIVPSLILADYNLSGGTTGIDVIRRLREMLSARIPALVLTADITPDTLRILSAEDCLHLPKPVGLEEMLNAVQFLLHTPSARTNSVEGRSRQEVSGQEIFIVDDDASIREALRHTFETGDRKVRTFPDGETFLAAVDGRQGGCLIMDVNLPGMNGLEVMRRLHERNASLPTIMITGSGDVAMAVEAMKAGAADFIEKPVGPPELLASVRHALERNRDTAKLKIFQQGARSKLTLLTERQRQILDRVLAGQPSKIIGMDLGISQRTVEAHRAAIMKRLGAHSLAALARIVLAAEGGQA